MTKKTVFSLLIVCVFFQAGCGQKGALMIPDSNAPAEVSNNLFIKNHAA